jgi:hypothetical protein
LEAPVEHVSDEQSSPLPDRDEVRPGELSGAVARLAERAKDISHPVELDYAVESTIGHPDMLIRRDKKAVGVADAVPLLQKLAVGVEDLNALVLAIADINAVVSVDDDRVRQIEFARQRSICTPRLDELAVTVELDDAGVPVAVRNEDVSSRTPRLRVR